MNRLTIQKTIRCSTAVIVSVFFISQALFSQARYPPRITYDPTEFKSFMSAYLSFKSSYNFSYDIERLDSAACTISQLNDAQSPIQLAIDFSPPTKGKSLSSSDSATAIIRALKRFLDTHQRVFHLSSQNAIIESVGDHGSYLSVIFARVGYGKHRASGQSRGLTEFILTKSGKIMLITSTMTRAVSSLPDSGRYSLDKIFTRLLGRTLRVIIDKKKISYVIDSQDVIRFMKTCVYESKAYEELYLPNGDIFDRKLRRATVHLAYEVAIDIGMAKPLAVFYYDAITGEEIAVDYPFSD